MPPNAVRAVGTDALYNTSRHALGICRRVCNTCRYSVPRISLQGQSLDTAIENALAKVVLRHGILRVGIAKENSKEPFFSFLETIDLAEMVRWQKLQGSSGSGEYDDALFRSLERIHDSLWENLETRAGWEVIVHHPADVETLKTITLDITFAFHHAYADGVASKLFHRDLLKALHDASGPTAELNLHMLRLPAPPELLPGVGTVVPFKISWTYLLRTIWNEVIYQSFVPRWLKSKPAADSIPWTGKPISIDPHHVNLRLVEISQDKVSPLLQACRERKTTLTPLLHVLVALSLAKRLPTETAPAFTTTTPVDLRRYAGPGYAVNDSMACLVSAHDDGIDSSTLSQLRTARGLKDREHEHVIWEATSALSTRLRHKISTLPNDDVMGMISWVSDWSKFWTDKFGTKRESTWELSNIGSLNAADAKGGSDGDWTILRSIMTQGALPAGAAFNVNVSGVEGESVCLTLSWQEGIVEAELMEGLEQDLGKWLE